MKILSISTATKNLSVAINDNQKILTEINHENQKNHSVNLMPSIEMALKKINLSLGDIDRFAVAAGPGSYTGLRIGATTAKTFADILKKELVGVSTLAALALEVSARDQVVLTVLDARNDNFFAGAYGPGKDNKIVTNLISDEHVHLTELVAQIKDKVKSSTPIIFVGEFTADHQKQFKELLADYDVSFGIGEDNLVHAGNIGRIGQFENPTDIDTFVPDYLRKTQAEIEWAQKNTKTADIKDSDYVEEV